MAYTVTQTAKAEPAAAAGTGATRHVLLDQRHGSVHMEVALLDLDPGAHVPMHLHPFEESFYVLEGKAVLALEGQALELHRDDYGFAPVRAAHGWRNPFSTPYRCLQVRVPQPRSGVPHLYPIDGEVPTAGGRITETDPRLRHVGHFDEADLGTAGPLSMPGYHGHNIRDISVRMMVDEVLGAAHHTLFVVQFQPNPTATHSASPHYHPFEESYFLLAGQADGVLDGDGVRVGAGDLVWTSTNGTHGFVNRGDMPVRWLEVQAPAPPPSDAFFFPHDWSQLSTSSMELT